MSSQQQPALQEKQPPQYFKGIVKLVLSGDSVIIRGQPKGGKFVFYNPGYFLSLIRCNLSYYDICYFHICLFCFVKNDCLYHLGPPPERQLNLSGINAPRSGRRAGGR